MPPPSSSRRCRSIENSQLADAIDRSLARNLRAAVLYYAGNGNLNATRAETVTLPIAVGWWTWADG